MHEVLSYPTNAKSLLTYNLTEKKNGTSEHVQDIFRDPVI